MRALSFTFEELPLVIENGFSAGLVSGSAEISYWSDGQWGIESISLDGSKAKQDARGLFAGFDRKPVELDAGDPIYLRIFDRLENEWRDKVAEKVCEQIAEDRAEASDARADYARDQMVGA